MLTFRSAVPADAGVIAAIYDRIHTQEEAGLVSIGWERGVYPTLQTAQAAIAAQDMFVAEMDGVVVASARINQEQVPEYVGADWRFPATPEQVMVLHTLTVDPEHERQGIATAFVRFYEEYAIRHHCPFLRMDTNAKNSRARALYHRLGYEEVGIVPCVFNGIDGVQLVCLEKKAESGGASDEKNRP